MFKILETDEALITDGGVYKPAEVYEGPEGGLYIKAKGGFVRLKANGSTSHPAVKVITLMREGPLFKDSFDRLAITKGPARKVAMLTHSADGAGEKATLAITKAEG